VNGYTSRKWVSEFNFFEGASMQSTMRPTVIAALNLFVVSVGLTASAQAPPPGPSGEGAVGVPVQPDGSQSLPVFVPGQPRAVFVPGQPPVAVAVQPGGSAASVCFIQSLNHVGIPSSRLKRLTGKNIETYTADQINREVYERLNRAARVFRVAPRFYFLDDRDGPNAFATPNIEGNPEDFPSDYSRFGTVVLGETLLWAEWQDRKRLPDPNPTAAPGMISYPADAVETVLAHELAHIVQNINRCPFEGKRRELQADYLAGWYVNHLKTRSNIAFHETAAFSSLYDKGDFNFFSQTHHGTPRERLLAFLAGFDDESLAIEQAYNGSGQYVSTLRERPIVLQQMPQSMPVPPPPTRSQ
jgi:hypothetical protein